MQIKILPQITLTEEGPAVTETIDHKHGYQLIHLKQGSLDGACGPYCLCMALILLGLEKHSKLSNLEHTERSKRLLSYISSYSDALITEGTYLHVLKKYAKIYEDKGLKVSSKVADLHGNDNLKKAGRSKDYTRVRDFIIENVQLNRPVIFGSVDHYSLVIGLGYDSETSDASPRYLFLLDPDLSTPTCAPWNGVVDLGVRGNNWFGTGGFTFEAALALWKE